MATQGLPDKLLRKTELIIFHSVLFRQAHDLVIEAAVHKTAQPDFILRPLIWHASIIQHSPGMANPLLGKFSSVPKLRRFKARKIFEKKRKMLLDMVFYTSYLYDNETEKDADWGLGGRGIHAWIFDRI
jgi:hypothetical protein